MNLWLSVLFLLGNAFFVGAEFSVMAARRSQLEPMAAAGSKRARASLQALEQVSSLLACAQLGITICSVLLGAVAEDAIHHLIAGPLESVGIPSAASDVIALVIALLIVAYLHVVLGEMVPKNLAIAGPDRAALALAPALLAVTRVLGPVIWLVEAISKWIVRRLGVEPKSEMTSTFSA
ncbi:MAG: CNNM domain-containing protein, partial [Allobranchiibius sp.]